MRQQAVRFAFSPLQEVVRALKVFVEPRAHAEQMPWLRQARRHATPAVKRGARRFKSLLTPAPELFPHILPSSKAVNFHQELALLSRGRRAFREAMARRFVGKPFVMRADLTDRSRAEALARLLRETAARDCDEVLAGFCDVLEEFFARCLASQWDFFEAAALRDARARESLLHRFGLTSALRTLTRELTATGDRTRTSLEFGGAASEGKRLDFPPDGTVLLTPSYFIWPHAAFVLMRGETVDFRVAYPIASPARVERRVGHWDASAKRFTALADPTRLRMLELLSYRDLSTREFAGVLGISEAGASRHLSILREAALVSAKRDSYFVLYRRTAIARAIVRAVLTPRE